MPSFKLRPDAKAWFSEIAKTHPLKTDFDLYYFCVLAGLAHGHRKSASEPGEKPVPFIEYWVAPYEMSQYLILGLLLRLELASNGIRMDEPSAVQQICSDLFTNDNQTQLTNAGMDRLNEFASGGYELLAEEFSDKPYFVHEFLLLYSEILLRGAERNPNWTAL